MGGSANKATLCEQVYWVSQNRPFDF
jgi:hypothetical protein